MLDDLLDVARMLFPSCLAVLSVECGRPLPPIELRHEPAAIIAAILASITALLCSLPGLGTRISLGIKDVYTGFLDRLAESRLIFVVPSRRVRGRSHNTILQSGHPPVSDPARSSAAECMASFSICY